MMTVTNATHHLPDPVLVAYAAGTLPEAFSLVAACHVSMCDECRAALAEYEALGGAVLENVEAAEISPDALAATMALIAKGAPEEAPKPRAAPSSFPAPLQHYVGGGPEAVRWRPIGAGARQAILPCKGGARARLLYIPPGGEMPTHTHRGLELTLVLEGAFSDEVSHFGRGDVEVGDEDLDHTPVADKSGPCICLAAQDAPLRFHTLLPRLIQPFLRI